MTIAGLLQAKFHFTPLSYLVDSCLLNPFEISPTFSRADYLKFLPWIKFAVVKRVKVAFTLIPGSLFLHRCCGLPLSSSAYGHAHLDCLMLSDSSCHVVHVQLPFRLVCQLWRCESGLVKRRFLDNLSDFSRWIRLPSLFCMHLHL